MSIFPSELFSPNDYFSMNHVSLMSVFGFFSAEIVSSQFFYYWLFFLKPCVSTRLFLPFLLLFLLTFVLFVISPPEMYPPWCVFLLCNHVLYPSRFSPSRILPTVDHFSCRVFFPSEDMFLPRTRVFIDIIIFLTQIFIFHWLLFFFKVFFHSEIPLIHNCFLTLRANFLLPFVFLSRVFYQLASFVSHDKKLSLPRAPFMPHRNVLLPA